MTRGLFVAILLLVTVAFFAGLILSGRCDGPPQLAECPKHIYGGP